MWPCGRLCRAAKHSEPDRLVAVPGRSAGADYELWGMRSIERALSQLVSGSAQGLSPALASLGDRLGFQRVGHRRIRAARYTCPFPPRSPLSTRIERSQRKPE